MAEFPAHLFRMEGDPSAIRGSAAKWSSFGTAATNARSEITSLDSSTFIGPEGDMWRDGLNEEMPDHLSITGEAFSKVSTALNTFAGTLSGLQDEMRPIAQRAPGLWEALQSAKGRVDRAGAADARHAREVADRPADSTEPDNYQSDSGAAQSALSDAQRQWDEAVGQANGLKSRLTTAVEDSVREIREAKDMRFKENPKWWDIGGHFQNFVRDHKELLQQLSGALKIVSLVTGLLSFIPVLTPIMAPIAMGTALAASAIDVSVYAATGEGDLKMILIDAGLNLIPFAGRAISGMSRVTSTGARVTMQRFGVANRVVVRASGGERFTQVLPRGSRFYTGAGGPSTAIRRAPAAANPYRRGHQATAYRGVSVSRSPGQNRLAYNTVQRLERSGASDIRVDQMQVDTAGMRVGNNRPDVSGTVGDQRLHFEYDRPPFDRVDRHITDNLTHDPNSVVITVPKN